MRTAGVFQQDTAMPDGMIFIPATPAIDALYSAALTLIGTNNGDPPMGNRLVRIAAGNVAYQTIAATSGGGPVQLEIPVNANLLMRYGVQDYAQEQWGSTANGGANFLATPPATFTTPYGTGGNPPFTGSTQLVPPTSRPKGVQINNIYFVYQHTATAVTNTCGIYSTVFANNVAPAVTTILALAANGLTTAVESTGPSVIKVAWPTPAMLVAKQTEYIIEWNVTPNGDSLGVTNIYGIFLDVSYNYN